MPQALAGRNLPYVAGYDFGIGLIAGTGMRCGKGVAGEVTGVQNNDGGFNDLKITKIETTSDLESILGISAEATGGVGLFSANARFDFAKSCQVNSQCITLVVVNTLEFGFQQIDEPALTEEARNIVAQSTNFQGRYGDLFVSGIGSGGLFVGVLQIDYSSEQSRQKISASMSGSYGLAFSAAAAANLSTALTSTSSSVRVFLHTEGGSLIGHEHPTTPEDLLAAHAAWFNSLVGPDGKGTDLKRPYTVQALPYTIADGPLPPNSADLKNQLDVLARCSMLRSATLDNLNLVTYVMEHGGQFDFGPTTAADLSAACVALGKDLQHIAKTASHALDHPEDAQWPEVYDTSDGYKFWVLDPNILPKLRATLEKPTPDLSHCSNESDARKKCSDQGFVLSVVVDQTQDAGILFKVLSQKPIANYDAPAGTVITLTIAKNSFDLMLTVLNHRGKQLRKQLSMTAEPDAFSP